MKHIVIGTALGAMITGTAALAQTSTSPSTTTSPPASPSTSMPSATTPPAPGTAARSATAPAGQLWYVAADADMRASKLIGTTVRNAANESIGDINEIILDPSGKVSAVVVGVGGFLGMGEREVAVSFNALKVSRDNSGNSIVSVDATKDSLRSAPAWTWKKS